MRKNRRPRNDTQAEDVWSHPERYTRAVRRSVGFRKPVSNAYTDGFRVGAKAVLDQVMQPTPTEEVTHEDG